MSSRALLCALRCCAGYGSHWSVVLRGVRGGQGESGVELAAGLQSWRRAGAPAWGGGDVNSPILCTPRATPYVLGQPRSHRNDNDITNVGPQWVSV
jgi:hypothetical protein